MNRGNVSALQDKIGNGNSLYLKAKDFEDQARRVRPIIWLYNGQPCDILTYLEGWHVTESIVNGKTIKAERPIRFNSDEIIPEGINWKMSSYKGEKEKPQTPKPSVAWLGWDYVTKSLKICTFAQVGVVTPISEMLSPTDKDGKVNESFIEDMTQLDIVIKKLDDKKFTITTQVPKGGQGLPPDALKALADFNWSWDAFMACQKLEEGEGITYNDVVDALTGNEPQKPVSKKEEKVVDNSNNDVTFTFVKDWMDVKTPAGKILGQQSLEDLQSFQASLEKKGKTVNNPLYDAIMSGIFSKNSGEGEEDEAF